MPELIGRLDPPDDQPTVFKFEATPASRLAASLASRCRAETRDVFAALVEKERSLISTRTR
jgi:hypothetical protein